MYALLGPPPALRKAARTIKPLSALSQLAALFYYIPSSSTYRIVADRSAPFSLRKTPKIHGIRVTFSTPSILLEKKIVVGEDLGIQLGIKKKKMARLGRQTRPTWGAFCCSHACFKLHIFIGLRSTLLTPTSHSRIYSSLWHFTATTSLFLLALSSLLFPISMSHTPTSCFDLSSSSLRQSQFPGNIEQLCYRRIVFQPRLQQSGFQPYLWRNPKSDIIAVEIEIPGKQDISGKNSKGEDCTALLRVALRLKQSPQDSSNTNHSILKLILFAFWKLRLRTMRRHSAANSSTCHSATRLYTKHCHIGGAHPMSLAPSCSTALHSKSDKTSTMPCWAYDESTNQECFGPMLYVSIKAIRKNARDKSG